MTKIKTTKNTKKNLTAGKRNTDARLVEPTGIATGKMLGGARVRLEQENCGFVKYQSKESND